jgi:TM2 domain-containing membrane protein YozV
MDHRYCGYCGELVNNKNARFCEKCGNELILNNVNDFDSDIKDNNRNTVVYHKNPYLAFLLSIFPGIGQMYNGQIFKGILIKIVWQILIIIGSLKLDITGMSIMLVTFLAVWFYNVIDAYQNAKEINENNGNYFYNENFKPPATPTNPDIKYKLQEIDIKINSFFHNIKNGKKVVSIVKVIMLILLSSILSTLIG